VLHGETKARNRPSSDEVVSREGEQDCEQDREAEDLHRRPTKYQGPRIFDSSTDLFGREARAVQMEISQMPHVNREFKTDCRTKQECVEPRG
jgi:hypothetical protein